MSIITFLADTNGFSSCNGGDNSISPRWSQNYEQCNAREGVAKWKGAGPAKCPAAHAQGQVHAYAGRPHCHEWQLPSLTPPQCQNQPAPSTCCAEAKQKPARPQPPCPMAREPPTPHPSPRSLSSINPALPDNASRAAKLLRAHRTHLVDVGLVHLICH